MISFFKRIKKRKYIDLEILSIIIGFIFVFVFQTHFYFLFIQKNLPENNNETYNLKLNGNEPNGAPLNINQFANVSSMNEPNSYPANVSFTLAEGWETNEIKIRYEGVSYKKNRVSNGEFTNNLDGWDFQTDNSEFTGAGWNTWVGPTPCTGTTINSGDYNIGDSGYYSQNISLNEALNNKIAKFSLDYWGEYDPSNLDASLYMAIIINGVEVNKTVDIDELTFNEDWYSVSLEYNPLDYNQELPGDISFRFGLSINDDCSPGYWQLFFDNIKFDLWSEPNQRYLALSEDLRSPKMNHTYTNSSYGKGYSIINKSYSFDTTKELIFTVYNNISNVISNVLDTSIDKIIVQSLIVKKFNSSYLGKSGSFHTIDEKINWRTSFDVLSPPGYNTYHLEINKPEDWNLTSIKDGFLDEFLLNCSGTDFDSNKTIIPSSILREGPWYIEAISKNYLLDAHISVRNGSLFSNETELNYLDLFHINSTLDSSINPENTQINSTIYYPNGSIFLNVNKNIETHNFHIGNFSVGKNMTVGTYQVRVVWENDLRAHFKNKIGYKQIEFNIIHHSDLTPENTYYELIQGDPLILKVDFFDFDFNESISFASVKYNSTYGINGDMIYQGLGTYIAEIDTSSLDFGFYSFSFSAEKNYYEPQYKIDLIDLKIIAQPLKIEAPKKTLAVIGNDYFSCNINLTGAISGVLISGPANISSDWQNFYEVIPKGNGTYMLNFSSINLPKEGITENFQIGIFANKTNYGTTSEFISINISPIQTRLKVNQTFIEAYINEIFHIKANFSEEISESLISNATCTVEWESGSEIAPISEGFLLSFSTLGLEKDTYNVLIAINKSAYETSFKSITVVIIDQEITVNVSINSEQVYENSLIDISFKEIVNFSVRVYAVGERTYLSNVNVSIIAESFHKQLVESKVTYYHSNLSLDASKFENGVNSMYLIFQKTNYTLITFPFQLLIHKRQANLSILIDSQIISENFLLSKYYTQKFEMTIRVLDVKSSNFVTNGTLKWLIGENSHLITESPASYYNITITLNQSSFTPGLNYMQLIFEKNIYYDVVFNFQINVMKLQFSSKPVNFNALIKTEVGEDPIIELQLINSITGLPLENVSVYYTWDYGFGECIELSNGTYQAQIKLPSGLAGSYEIVFLASKDINYETTQFSYILVISNPQTSNIGLWIFILILLILVSIASLLLGRTYYFIPRKKAREKILHDKIQPYKDARNILGINIMNKVSGLTLYSKKFSYLLDIDESLFSGFIQAIMIVGRELGEERQKTLDWKNNESKVSELDFKYFYILLHDHKELRVFLILKSRASRILRQNLIKTVKILYNKLAFLLQNFQGDLSHFADIIRPILNEYLFLFFKGKFKMTNNDKYYHSLKRSGILNNMEKIVFDIIDDFLETNDWFEFSDIIKLVEEEKEDLIINALLSLLKKKIIISKERSYEKY